MPEEVKDKTTEEVKFSPEEMTQVQNIQQSYLTVQNQFGQLKLAQIKLDEDEVQLEENLNQLKEEEGQERINIDKMKAMMNQEQHEDKLEQNEELAGLRAGVSLAKQQMADASKIHDFGRNFKKK